MINIYLVEDEIDFHETITQLLDSSPEFNLLGSAYDAESALEDIKDLKPDIALVDIGLPKMTGIECISHLKKLNLETQFVVFTFSDEDENIFEAIKSGAISYLRKTSSPTQLLDALKSVYNGGSAISSDIARKILNVLANTKGISIEEQRSKFNISKREAEVLTNLSKGLSYQEAADKMFISVSTLKSHIQNIYEKLHVKNNVEAIKKFFEN